MHFFAYSVAHVPISPGVLDLPNQQVTCHSYDFISLPSIVPLFPALSSFEQTQINI